MLDVTSVIVGIRCTNTHGLDLVDTAHLVDDNLKGIDCCIHISLASLITLGLDGCCGLDVATTVNDTKHGVSSS